jgi:rRNA processing protein Gar1
LKKKWVKLNLFYIGESAKKHQIFRVNHWNSSLERIIKQPIYNENYQIIGLIKDIFGPISLPFVSIKLRPNTQFNPNLNFYTKLP